MLMQIGSQTNGNPPASIAMDIGRLLCCRTLDGETQGIGLILVRNYKNIGLLCPNLLMLRLKNA